MISTICRTRQFIDFNELQDVDFNELMLNMPMQWTKLGMFSLDSCKSTTCNSFKATHCRMCQLVEINEVGT